MSFRNRASGAPFRVLPLLVVGTLCPLLAFAQLDPLQETWRWTEFDEDSGLPSDRVLSLIETTGGTPWALTDRGLAFYDDFEWQTVAVHHELTWQQCSLDPDLRDGVILTCEGRLFRGGKEGIEQVSVEFDGSPLTILYAVASSRDALILTTDGGYFLQSSDGVHPFPPLPPEANATASGSVVQRSPEGVLWARSTTTTFVLRNHEWVKLLDARVDHLLVEETGGLLSVPELSRVGLWRWNGALGTPPARHPEEGVFSVRALHGLSGGNAVACYNSGQVRVRRDGQWSWLNPAPVQLAHANFVLYRPNGDLWVGSEDRLALHRAAPRWQRWSQRSNPDSNQVNELLITRSGDLWTATAGGAFIRRKDGSVEEVGPSDGETFAILTGLHEDREGGVWVSSGTSFPGAWRLHEGTWRHYGSPDGLHATRVHKVVGDRSGRVWFLGLSPELGQNEPGAFVYDGATFEAWGESRGLLSGRVYAFADGPAGDLWFGTTGGISRFQRGRWTHWDSGNGLATDRVFTLALSGDRLWFGHGEENLGLGFIDQSDKVGYLTETDGLVNGKVKDLEVAPDGTLWIATRSGLGCYQDGRFGSFHRGDGLDHPWLWPIFCVEDKVYMGTRGSGVRVLCLEERASPPPRVSATWSASDAGIHFRWRPASYYAQVATDRIQTRYRLNRESWSNWSTSRALEATNLRPGEHTFAVQAKGLFGHFDEVGASLTITLPPPLHRHPVTLAIAGLILLLLGTVFFLDWRRRVRQSRLLRASEERHRLLIQEIPLCIHEIDLDGRLLSMNPVGLKMVGAESEDSIVGLDFFSTVTPADHERISGLFEETKRGQASEFELTLLVAGEARTFQSAFVPIHGDDGSIIKVLSYCQETTAMHEAEKQRADLQKQLHAAQKLEAVGLLAGGVAHDFNNLLTVMVAHSDLIQEDPSRTKQVKASVREIQRAQERAATLTRQLLAFGRKQVRRPRILSLPRAISDATEILRRLVGAHIEFEIDLSEEECPVLADPGQLEQVLMNLVVNARDALPNGGKLTLRCTPRELTSPLNVGETSIAPGKYVVLTVSDNGTGMNERTRSRIFDPFFTTKGPSGGSGLGLSTVHGIVEQSGGHVTVESSLGEGSEFSVFLPRAEEMGSASPSKALSLSRTYGSETVLVVDDEASIRDVLCKTLEGRGYSVIVAGDGVEALEQAKQYDGQIHLLLTDVVMPRMGGHALARHFYKLYPEAKILFMTGYAGTSGSPDQIGTATVSKPFRPEELASRIRVSLDS